MATAPEHIRDPDPDPDDEVREPASASDAPWTARGSPDDAARRQLLVRMAAGDRVALAALYTQEQGAILAYLRAFTDDAELAEEVLQDTFLAAWRGAARYEGRASVRSWLFAIARRRAADRLRRPSLPQPRGVIRTRPTSPSRRQRGLRSRRRSPAWGRSTARSSSSPSATASRTRSSRRSSRSRSGPSRAASTTPNGPCVPS